MSSAHSVVSNATHKMSPWMLPRSRPVVLDVASSVGNGMRPGMSKTH